MIFRNLIKIDLGYRNNGTPTGKLGSAFFISISFLSFITTACTVLTMLSNAVSIGSSPGSSTDDGGVVIGSHVSRSVDNPLYSGGSQLQLPGPPQTPQTTSSGFQIASRVREQTARRQLLGVGIVSALALLIALIALTGSNKQTNVAANSNLTTLENSSTAASATNQGLLSTIVTLETRLDDQAALIVSSTDLRV